MMRFRHSHRSENVHKKDTLRGGAGIFFVYRIAASLISATSKNASFST